MVKRFSILALLAIGFFLQGCTVESFNRTVYDMLQTWGEQQCQQDPHAPCETQSYEEYRQEREPSPSK